MNTVVAYEIDPATGMLTQAFRTKVDSDYPKMLAIYPDEKHYLTVNNTSNDIYLIRSIMRKVFLCRRRTSQG